MSKNSKSTSTKSAPDQLSSRSTRSSFSSLAPPLIKNPRKKRRTHSPHPPAPPLSSSTTPTPTSRRPPPPPISRSGRLSRPRTPAPATTHHHPTIEDDEDDDEASSNSNSSDSDSSNIVSSEGDDDNVDEEGEGSELGSGPNTPRRPPSNDEVFAQMDEDDLYGTRDADSLSSGSEKDEDEYSDNLPDVTQITLNFRKGQPPCTSTVDQDAEPKNLRRIKDWPAVDIIHNRDDEFDLFLGRIKGNLALLRKKSEKNKALRWWDTETPYIQPNHSKRQAEFAPLTPDDFEIKIAHAYHAEVARERLAKKRFPVRVHVYIYLRDPVGEGSKTLKRQKQVEIEEANRLINEARAAGTLNIGNVTQTLYARKLASSTTRKDDDPIPPPPDNTLYRQTANLDNRLADLRRRREADEQESQDIVPLKVRLGDQWVTIPIDITEIRKALGFDLVRIGETTRDVLTEPIAAPDIDVPDTEHLLIE